MATQKTTRQVFVNLSVKDLNRTKEFFTLLGFEFNAQFTNDQGACMIISEQAYVMLLVEPFFKTFTTKQICDASKESEAITALSCSSRAEVDEMVQRALEAGAKPALPPQDHGFMYSRSFYDIDDHHWELVWMDLAQVK